MVSAKIEMTIGITGMRGEMGFNVVDCMTETLGLLEGVEGNMRYLKSMLEL